MAEARCVAAVVPFTPRMTVKVLLLMPERYKYSLSTLSNCPTLKRGVLPYRSAPSASATVSVVAVVLVIAAASASIEFCQALPQSS